ncbi:MAG: hypothetical protein RJQ09_01980 [Cyclobacteriaceae bacterium]
MKRKIHNTQNNNEFKSIALYLIFLASGTMMSMLEKEPDFEAPLFDNLGDYHLDVTTESRYADRFFNQGVIWANGFNHMEAARSFKEAARLDPQFPMAYWGIAYVLGPNYNTSGMMTDDRNEVINAAKMASELAPKAKPWEKSLITAIAAKYPENGESADEEAYMNAMKVAFNQHPENDLIATLYAESIMNIHAWDLYEKKGGAPKPWTPELVSVIEKALELNPQNPLANHLYIHSIEASSKPERGIPSADKLVNLVPGSGHLVHMPSHIYIITGDYAKGSMVNEMAVKVDSAYIAQCKVQGVYPNMYYPHNYHFLAATAALEGRGARSIEAAFKTADIIDRNYLDEPGFETTQHFITIPYNVLVKFAQWEKILSLPKPKKYLEYPTAIWRYARGMAYANTDKVDQAKAELVELKLMQDSEGIKKINIFEINTGADVVEIAINVLSGEIKKVQGDYEAAVNFYQSAINVEDQLTYTEPPDWFFSVRHMLGDVYMRMKKFELAEKAYREDLASFPKNGFALSGLHHSLKGQGKIPEANKVLFEFQKAWKNADSELKFSRIDPAKRKNLAINIRPDSPDELIYMAGTFCTFN